MLFSIKVTETLSKIVEVKANTINDAIYEVKNMYKTSKIILDADDFAYVNFEEDKKC